jgi:aminodeoxyfutalosine deaminase
MARSTSSSIASNIVRIVTANWVLTLDGPAIRNGAIALAGDRVVDVGEMSILTARYPAASVECYPGIFMPALVNAHMHLELSHLQTGLPLSEEELFTDWIEALLIKRGENTLSENDIVEITQGQIEQQYNSGVAFIGDIGNDPNPPFFKNRNNKEPEIYRMVEFLGSTKEAQQITFERLSDLSLTYPATAHAPYSTRPETLVEIKKRCKKAEHIFSVHTAEVAAEEYFIHSQTGQFVEFLKKRGSWNGDFFEKSQKSKSSIDYFSKLGLLDEQTLLVHCVHLSEFDLDIIENSGAHICVCPGSNSFLHSGVAPIGEMISHGILPAIGTDSLASNVSLDMWGEMQRIYKEHPDVDSLDILKMATQAGARAFDRMKDYGTLSVGKKASFLHICSTEINNCITESDLLNMLITYGRPENIEWIHQSSMSSRSN